MSGMLQTSIINLRRQVSLPLIFTRNATRQALKYRRPRPGQAERPPPKYVDPLASNDTASRVTSLEDNLTFIHRPPPTTPTPHSLTTNPASPLLRPATSSSAALPPLVHPNTKAPPPPVPEKTVRQIRSLREKNPGVYTRGYLAKRFGVTQNFVGQVAALKKPLRKKVIAKRDEKHEEDRKEWSDRHSLVKAIQHKRKEMW